MRRWLMLGLVGLILAWGPYVYSELRRKPIRAHERAPLERNTDAARAPPETPHPPPPLAAVHHVPVSAPAPRPLAVATEPPPEDPKPEPEPEPEPELEEPEPPPPPPNPRDIGLPGDLTPKFQRAFDSEPRDAFWASDEEPKLRSLFEDVGVPASSVKDVMCRKTVCRVAFSSAGIESDVEGKLYAKVRQEFGQTLALDVQPGQEEATASLFVLRPGYKLEAPPER